MLVIIVVLTIQFYPPLNVIIVFVLFCFVLIHQIQTYVNPCIIRSFVFLFNIESRKIRKWLPFLFPKNENSAKKFIFHLGVEKLINSLNIRFLNVSRN